MEIKDLIVTVDVPMEFHGKTINLKLKTGGVSRNKLAEIRSKLQSQKGRSTKKKTEAANPNDDGIFTEAIEQIDEAVEVVSLRLVGWDLTDGGKPLPVSKESLYELPAEFVFALSTAVIRGGKSGPTTNATTSAGSGQQA